MKKARVLVAFDGDCENDVDRAALELERAGFQVARLTNELRATLDHPLDDFLEATIALDAGQEADDEAIDEICDQVSDIVLPHGGWVDEYGPLRPNHSPFSFFGFSGFFPNDTYKNTKN